MRSSRVLMRSILRDIARHIPANARYLTLQRGDAVLQILDVVGEPIDLAVNPVQVDQY